ncbi:signal peptidase I [uncultured Dubosiella sp.]|uniref:signal peptidase I n=1 Tax=uncultured Dubosiella sp. TaxID=1937011 RepID=UPI0027317EC5|nr:signal peptidase I [uncultured Dubosiella sp.]
MRKKERENKRLDMPTRAELEKERDRVRHNRQYRQTLRSTMGVLVVVAALAILAATLWLPVLRIYGTSMTPNLTAGDIVLSVKGSDFKTGDVIAFYYNNKILVKRVIARPGDWVYIDDDGNVFVNGEEIDEPYVQEKALGETDLEYPYQVPEKRWFVMGDHRSVSLDSRTRAIGPIAEEMIVGKLEGRIWPLNKIGKI